jgi:hypothetical protein
MIFLSVAYLRGKDNELVIKEVGFVKLNPNTGSSQVQCFLFKPPYGEGELSDKQTSANAFMTRNFHKIKWNDGHIPYTQLSYILLQACKGEREIYAKGSEQARLFSKVCNMRVFDLDEIGCPKAQKIKINNIHSCIVPHTDHCAMAKCLKYAEWMKIDILTRRLQDTLFL